MKVEMQTQDDIDAIEAKKKKDERLAEIEKDFAEIDKKKIRPLTAFMLKTETKEDTKILKELDEKAKSLREEKKKLEGA